MSEEDYNVPSQERIVLLQRLQDLIGDVPVYFWAACQICDIHQLGILVNVAEVSPPGVRIIAGRLEG